MIMSLLALIAAVATWAVAYRMLNSQDGSRDTATIVVIVGAVAAHFSAVFTHRTLGTPYNGAFLFFILGPFTLLIGHFAWCQIRLRRGSPN